ncbi:pyridoxamine 5'-phosphate oxidase family protein [Gordonia sp. NPDC003376]
MKLSQTQARQRLDAHDHAVLATVHPRRGVDAVPVVYALDDEYLGIPVDRVKPKSSIRLQRERNLEADPRATLLVEQWDALDWSRLWWVRAELRWAGPDHSRADALGAALARRYPQYADQPFAAVLVFRVEAVTGWSGSGP